MAMVAVIMICVSWLIAFSSWRLRTWRTAAVLLCGSATIFAVSLLPWPVAPVAAGGVWVVLTLLVLTRSEALAAVSDTEYAFIRRYAALLARIAELKGAAFTMEPASYVAEFEQLTNAFERLDAPSSEWTELRAETVRELRRRATIMRLGSRPAPDTMDRANEAWAAVETRFEQLFGARKRFWAPRPRPSPRGLEPPAE